MKAIDIRLIHRGEFMCFYEIDYIDKTGYIKTYEMVSKQGAKRLNTPDMTIDTIGNTVNAVVMIVFNEDHSRMLLSKEFRLGVNNWVYNPVAGLIDPGETAEEAAARELFEETGLNLIKIVDKLPCAYTSAPVTDEMVPVFICEASGDIKESDNPVEIIHPEWCDKQRVSELIKSGEVRFSGRMQAFAYMWINGGK